MNLEKEFSPDKAIEKYLPLMHEVAIRIDLVAQANEGKLNLDPPYAREYSYLQFRRICELTALGCLQLHGDLPQARTKSMKKNWHAEKIMSLLHKNHKSAFPQSIVRTKTDDGWHIQANSVPNAMKRNEFKKLYEECGEVLHRGTIKTLEGSDSFSQEDYDKVRLWQDKIVNLLNEHAISRANSEGIYITSLRTESGYPECSLFTMLGDGNVTVATKKLSVKDDIVHSYIANKKS